MYRWVRLRHTSKDDDNKYIHSLNISVLFVPWAGSHPVLMSWFLHLSPQWDRAPVLPPNTVRARDTHQGQWTESVHFTEARAGSGLPQQTPRPLQLALHLLSGTSSSRRSWGTQTRKLSWRQKRTFFFFFLTMPHFRIMAFLQWWTLFLRQGCQFWFSLQGRDKDRIFLSIHIWTLSIHKSPGLGWWPLKALICRFQIGGCTKGHRYVSSLLEHFSNVFILQLYTSQPPEWNQWNSVIDSVMPDSIFEFFICYY